MLAIEGFKCKTQATGGWPAPPGHSRVLFGTVELRFGTRHDHILAHWCPPENRNFGRFSPIPTHRGAWGTEDTKHPPAQPSTATWPGSHLDALNGAFKIGPKDGHKGLQVQNPGDRRMGGAAGPLQSAV